MKILHVVPSYLPARRYGGPIFAIHALCKAQVEAGAEVTVLTTDADGPGRSDVPLSDGTPQPVELDGVRVHYFARSFPRRLYRAPGLARFLRAHVREYDVVHLHSIWLWPTACAARAARRAGVPWIVSPRGMLVSGLIRRRGSLRKRAWLSLVERKTLEGASRLHATSSLEVADAAELGFGAERWSVVPNGVEIPPALPEREIRTRPRIVFLGRLSWKKGLERLFEALVQVPDAELVVAGPDDEGLTPRLAHLAASLGIDQRVEMRGPAWGPDRSALFAEADVVCVPSLSENFGNVVTEALAHATPVVCTPGVGAGKLVSASRAGAVTASDSPADIAEALARLLELTPEERAELGHRGRECVQQRCAWPHVAAELLDVYGTVIRSAS